MHRTEVVQKAQSSATYSARKMSSRFSVSALRPDHESLFEDHARLHFRRAEFSERGYLVFCWSWYVQAVVQSQTRYEPVLCTQ